MIRDSTQRLCLKVTPLPSKEATFNGARVTGQSRRLAKRKRKPLHLLPRPLLLHLLLVTTVMLAV